MSGDHNFIEVSWEVADGYCGHRPQKTRIPRSEIEDATDEAEVREIIQDFISSDFTRRISADYGDSVYSEALELWRESREGKSDE